MTVPGPEGFALAKPRADKVLCMPDTNLFVAAIRGGARQTDSLRLLVLLIEDQRFHLIGNRLLVEEYRRYGLAFPTPTAVGLLAGLLRDMDIVEPDVRFLRACEPHFAASQTADVLHAATCLETGALLISNDHHFDAIVRTGLIRRMTLTEAIRTLLQGNRGGRHE